MNKRQKKKFNKKGCMKKVVFDDVCRITEYGIVIYVIIKHGKIRNCIISKNDITCKNRHLTKDEKRRVILLARQMHRIKRKCADLTPGFRFTQETDIMDSPKLQYYEFDVPYYTEYINNKGE